MTVSINRNRSELWKEDHYASVHLYNTWFMTGAPDAYREARAKVVANVESLFRATNYMRDLTPDILLANPEVVSTLRQTTAPPLAVDRLMGLAYADNNLMKNLEAGRLPKRMKSAVLRENLERVCQVIDQLLDRTLFEWLEDGSDPTPQQLEVASVVVGDRRANVLANPVIRNVQEARQMAVIEEWLKGRGYTHLQVPAGTDIHEMAPGTYSIHQNVPVFSAYKKSTNMPFDIDIQPFKPLDSGMPLLVEAKSAGDETNTNKRRKEEAQKAAQLRSTYGEKTDLVLFLTGYFAAGYLGYEAQERIDWVWEHRVEDFALAGL